MKAAISFPREELVSLGTCFGKFTRSGKFHLKVTCLDFLAEHAKVRVRQGTSARQRRAAAQLAAAAAKRSAPALAARALACLSLHPIVAAAARLSPTPSSRSLPPQYKVWVKPSAEMSFLYGNDIPKTGIARMTEAIPQYAGVVIFSLNNMALGFGRANHTTDQCKDLEGPATVVLHQSDIGEYLRLEDELA